MKVIRAVVVAAVLAAGLVSVSTSSAHIRYDCGWEYNPTGICTYFNGETVVWNSDYNYYETVDPINIVWYPYGLWNWNIQNTFAAIGWHNPDGSPQVNYRLLGDECCYYYFDYAGHLGQRATGAAARFHARVFRGHNHYDDYNDWSVSDAHEEDDLHNIVSWEYAEDTLRGSAEGAWREGEAAWTYLPRAEGWFQNQYSNGWADRIAPW
jgi:hypothetical protein